MDEALLPGDLLKNAAQNGRAVTKIKKPEANCPRLNKILLKCLLFNSCCYAVKGVHAILFSMADSKRCSAITC